MAFLEYVPRQTLYQYCSPQAFKGIISSKALWFSDLGKSTDPRELRFGFDNILRAIEAAQRGTQEPSVAALVRKLSERLTYQHDNVAVYCACLTLAADSLPMWAEYGGTQRDERDGLAIGFRAGFIDDAPVRVQKVRYAPRDHEKWFRDLLIDLATQVDAFGETLDWRREVRSLTAAFRCMTSIKHASWAYEDEVRAIYVQERQQYDPILYPELQQTNAFPNSEPIGWSVPLERQSRGENIGYFALRFGTFISFKLGNNRGRLYDASWAIERVIIGQNCSMNKTHVENFLRLNGFRNFEVVRSECLKR